MDKHIRQVVQSHVVLTVCILQILYWWKAVKQKHATYQPILWRFEYSVCLSLPHLKFLPMLHREMYKFSQNVKNYFNYIWNTFIKHHLYRYGFIFFYHDHIAPGCTSLANIVYYYWRQIYHCVFHRNSATFKSFEDKMGNFKVSRLMFTY